MHKPCADKGGYGRAEDGSINGRISPLINYYMEKLLNLKSKNVASFNFLIYHLPFYRIEKESEKPDCQ